MVIFFSKIRVLFLIVEVTRRNDKNTNNQFSSINKTDSDKNTKNKIKKNEHNIDINA